MSQDQGTIAADMSAAEIAALYSEQFSDMKSRVKERVPFLPRINLTGPKTMYKTKKGVEVGDWYLTPGDTPQGDDPAYENLGKSFECTVLHDSTQLVMRDDENNRPLIESTEFQNNTDPIFLFDGRSGPMHIAAVAPYGGKAARTMKELRNDPRWPHKPSKDGQSNISSIGFTYNVYVLLPDGRIAVVGNTKRGHFGTDSKGDSCSYGDLAPDSYMRARATCHEAIPGLTLGHRWRVSSVEVGGGSDEPRPAFEILGLQDPRKIGDIREAATELQRYLLQKWTDRIGYAWSNTSPAQRESLITAYSEIRPLLDTMDGHEIAAKIVLGKKTPPALLSQPEPDYTETQAQLKADEKRGIADLEKELEDEAALPPDKVTQVIDTSASVPGLNYKSDVKVEDLPF